MIKIFLFCFYKIWFPPDFGRGSLKFFERRADPSTSSGQVVFNGFFCGFDLCGPPAAPRRRVGAGPPFPNFRGPPPRRSGSRLGVASGEARVGHAGGGTSLIGVPGGNRLQLLPPSVGKVAGPAPRWKMPITNFNIAPPFSP